ncbi:MAG: hypothetical protein OMM_05243 [Candidatus Magnetoglobus multicellularis str. Araruama]|uniref:Uncharacterized protein n=1 Tax=Candidatus Magnetoglobus multicellularis str. Araruama TaxID=890399 RepID=A0A1V1NXF9_9BACT|nr:MAG: hypothetical protein OMM_05243 [Candidatus Magnetoglobus multicellularis str. Araruama]
MIERQDLNNDLIRDQIVGIINDNINIQRSQNEINHLFAQDNAFLKAVEQIDKVREFVGRPEKIIGSEFTKHGEIAEQVEVGVRNARQAIEQQEMTATFNGIGRTAPEDYVIDGTAVQSKFINGINNNLDHVLKHMNKYSEFGREGSYYHIPKDSHDVITKILNNEPVEGLTEKSVRAIKEKIAIIETKSGNAFNEVVKPGVSDYSEVQQGKIHETLNRHENDLNEKNNQLKDQIVEKHQPSFGETAKAAGMGAAVGGAVTLTASIYKNYKQGKIF